MRSLRVGGGRRETRIGSKSMTAFTVTRLDFIALGG